MAEEPKWNPPDTGISYAGSTNAVQKLLDKLKSYKKKPTDQGAEEGSIAGMNVKLDALIEFRDKNQAPETGSWNPFKAHRQQKELERWVKNRPPGAGITGEQLEKQYPGHPGRTKHLIGATTGGVLGATGGIIGAARLARKFKVDPQLPMQVGASIGTAIGGAGGWFASDPKHFIETHKQHKADLDQFSKSFEKYSVPVAGLKAAAPIATSHGQVAGELKKQNVGFLKRHAAGLSTFPIRHSDNAAFLPIGEKGVIVSGQKVPRIVIAHEGGHAKDYAHYGGEAGFRTAYPRYGQPTFTKKAYIHNTLLPEHRAWAHAHPRTKKDRDLQDAALRTYARGGFLLSDLLDDLIEFSYETKYGKNAIESAQRKWKKPKLAVRQKAKADRLLKMIFEPRPGPRPRLPKMQYHLSAKLDDLINFQDPRPRSPVTGEFQPQGEGGPSPNDMATVYKQPQQNQNPSIMQGGGLALTGGALGAIGAAGGKHGYHSLRKVIQELASRKRSSRIIRP